MASPLEQFITVWMPDEPAIHLVMLDDYELEFTGDVPPNAWSDGSGDSYWTDGGGDAYWTDGA